jgi:hypothetical protein
MGYRRIHGELAGLGVNVAAPAVWEILNANGTGPAPRRTGPAWSQFLHSQAEAIVACGFFSVDLLDGTRAYALTVTGHATRRIRIPGVTLYPTGEWTAQQARNLITDLGEQAERMKFMIRDHGPDFTPAFDAVLADAGIRTVLCNVRTPRMNAIAEVAGIGGCRRELLDRTLSWNQNHLQQIRVSELAMLESSSHTFQHGKYDGAAQSRRRRCGPGRSGDLAGTAGRQPRTAVLLLQLDRRGSGYPDRRGRR